MPVSFLDLAPAPPSETVTVHTQSGLVDLELSGVRIAVLQDLARKYPSFARLVEGGGGSVIEATDAMPALIAASLGHPGEAAWESKVAEFSAADVMVMALAAVRLTFPPARPVPLEEAEVVPNGADLAAQPRLVTSPLRLSS